MNWRSLAWSPWGALVVGGAACSDPPPRPRPVEVPIREYDPAAGVDRPGSPRRGERAAPRPVDGEATVRREPATTGTSGPVGGVGSVPEAPRGEVSRELDTKNGFLGAIFGSPPSAHRGLQPEGRRGDSATYRVTDKSYGGLPLREVLFIFRKGKLASIQFTLRSVADCRPAREMLQKELGPPQRATGETLLWRGERTGLRFVTASSGVCSGTVQSREHAPAEWSAM